MTDEHILTIKPIPMTDDYISYSCECVCGRKFMWVVDGITHIRIMGKVNKEAKK